MRNEGLLAEQMKCDNCGGNMYEAKRNGKDGLWWRCSRRACRRSKTVREGSFFVNANISLCDCMMVIYRWASGSTEKLMRHDLRLSKQTIVDWCSMCREVCVMYFDEMEEKIGGVGEYVEIDETVIVKRKYDRGRLLKEGWLFGGIQRTMDGSFKCFMRIVYNRSEAHLVHIIKQHVLPGTHIITDGWSAYQNLVNYGYKHSVVIHENNFVSPENELVHTQKIESTWSSLKRFIRSRGTNKGDQYVDYIYEWIFRRIHDNVFEAMIDVIKSKYQLNWI